MFRTRKPSAQPRSDISLRRACVATTIYIVAAALVVWLFPLTHADAAVAMQSAEAADAVGASATTTRSIERNPMLPAPDFEQHSRVVATTRGGDTIELPTLTMDIDAAVQGDIADVTIRQTFANPSALPLEAQYTFPLPTDAAVYAMTMTVGDERIVAQIQERAEAEETFEAAQDAGQAAALLSQSRANVFVQRIANLMPGLPIEVELRYIYALPRTDGRYELALPLIVGPRYTPAAGLPAGTPAVAVGPPTLTPEEAQRVSLDITIDAGMRVHDVHSATHPLHTQWRGDDYVSIAPQAGTIADDRDFIVSYRLGDDDLTVGALSSWGGDSGTVSLRIEPAPSVATDEVVRREMVFVLDTSGSMSGSPLETSKALVQQTLRTLRPTDHFRVIQFGSRATEYSDRPILATRSSVAHAIAHVGQMHGGGGTEMRLGVEQALRPEVPEGAIRVVVFLTDGYIGNEAEIIHTIEDMRGDARLVGVGVGSAVNRFLLEEMGRAGRGFTRIATLDEDADLVVEELHGRLNRPVLTDIEVDWGDAQATQMVPHYIPDLFAGQSIRVEARYANPGTHTVTVRGRNGAGPVAIPMQVVFDDGNQKRDDDAARSDALSRMWARGVIGDLAHQYTRAQYQNAMRTEALPDAADDDMDAIKAEVTRLGLAHALVTDWTSFVAVSERVVNPNRHENTRAAMPTTMPHGVSAQAYGGGSFHGTSTPEPLSILATLTALGAAAGASRRRRAGDAADEDDDAARV